MSHRRSHHRHSAVSAFSCRPLFSFPVLVCCPILHAVVFRSYHYLPLPSSSATAVFHRHSHHHQSAFSAISHCPLLSFSIAVRHPNSRVVLIRHRRHPLPPLSAIAVPPLLVLPPTLRCWLLHYADVVTHLWQSLVAAIITSHPPVLPTFAFSPCPLLPQSTSACCCWTPLVLPSTFRCWLLRCRRQKLRPDQPTTGYLWWY